MLPVTYPSYLILILWPYTLLVSHLIFTQSYNGFRLKTPTSSRKSIEEELCDQHFVQTHSSRAEDGLYCVQLPFKPHHPSLGQSYQIAEKRFLYLEQKFETQPHLKDMYVNSMKECENLGYMSKVESLDPNDPHTFLPHHGVIKENGN